MSPHRRKTPWQEEIDPGFNREIRRYIEAFRKMYFPLKEGYLRISTDEREHGKTELQGIPGVFSLYENDKHQDVLYDTGLAPAEAATRQKQEDLFFVWNTISLMTNRKPMKELYLEARRGDDDSLFRLIRVDKSLFDHDWVRARIRKAFHSGDDKFFISIGEALAKKPLNAAYDDLEIALALMRFWDLGLSRLTLPQTRQLLLDSGIHFIRGDCSFNHVRVRLRPFLKTR